jgi:hypothetical protein
VSWIVDHDVLLFRPLGITQALKSTPLGGTPGGALPCDGEGGEGGGTPLPPPGGAPPGGGGGGGGGGPPPPPPGGARGGPQRGGKIDLKIGLVPKSYRDFQTCKGGLGGPPPILYIAFVFS